VAALTCGHGPRSAWARGAVMLKSSRVVPEIWCVEQQPRLERCPYDRTPVVADAYPGGFIVLSCEACGASWELHNALVRRVSEPDWNAAHRAADERRLASIDPSV
jgi:hypothetical protein